MRLGCKLDMIPDFDNSGNDATYHPTRSNGSALEDQKTDYDYDI